MNGQTAPVGIRTGKAFLGGLVACALVAALLVWLAPEERSLGAGIKVVYVHVALVWTGLTGLALTGLLGLALVISGDRRLANLAQTTGWVACAFFAAGLAMSIVAAKVNWGGMFWQEPRTAASLRALALGVLVLGAAGWLGGGRRQGLLYLLPAGLVVWSFPGTRLVLHPQSAIWSSPSVGIRFTFLAMFVVFSLAALQIVAYYARQSPVRGGSALRRHQNWDRNSPSESNHPLIDNDRRLD